MIDYNHYVQREADGQEYAHWRQQLLALLAGERADLLMLLLGLDEQMLTGQPVFEKHTARDILAHIASWDDLHRERMALALQGRENEIEGVELDDRNAQLQEQHQHWTLEQAVTAFREARRQFLETLAHVPDERLHQALDMPRSPSLPLRTLALWRARHDAGHAADLRQWREQQDAPFVTGPTVLLIEALRASRDDIAALAGLVPLAERTERRVTGAWNFRDIVGHVADWEQFLLETLRSRQLLDMGYDGDVDRWNEAHVEARQGQSWEETWQDYVQTRQQLIDMVAGMDKRALAAPLPNLWTPDTTVYRNIVWWLEHERQHAGWLREALVESF